jgi:polysaccharide transporter, PST family
VKLRETTISIPGDPATAIDAGETLATPASIPTGATNGSSAPTGLLQTSVWGAVSTVVRVATGLTITKMIALWVGPAGLAIVGQFGSFAATTAAFAGGGINLGVTKYMAEYSNSRRRQARLLSTALVITLCSSIVLAVVIGLCRRLLSSWLMGTPEYGFVFGAFAIVLVLVGFNSLLISVLTGTRQVPTLVALNVLSSLFVLAASVLLIGRLELSGALLALAIAQGLSLPITISFVKRSGWFHRSHFTAGYDLEVGRKLSKYAAMAITTALTLPLSHILVRNHIASNISWEAAGYWQGIWQISEGYLLIVTSVLTMYYLPRLAELRDGSALRVEIMRAYRTLLPIAMLAAAAIYFFRDVVLTVLFAGSFGPMRDLFAAQLIGDVLKVASWLLSYLMVAKAMIKTFVVTEVVFAATFVGLTVALTGWYGLVGVTYAFAANYTLYLLTMMVLFRSQLVGTR